MSSLRPPISAWPEMCHSGCVCPNTPAWAPGIVFEFRNRKVALNGGAAVPEKTIGNRKVTLVPETRNE
jgi:hypothetical protein